MCGGGLFFGAVRCGESLVDWVGKRKDFEEYWSNFL